MLTTLQQDKEFGGAFLGNILNWVANYFSIDALYSDEEIKMWLEDHASEFGYVKEDEQ